MRVVKWPIFRLKLGFLGLLIIRNLFIYVHLVPNLSFKNVALPLFDPKIGPKKEVIFWPF